MTAEIGHIVVEAIAAFVGAVMLWQLKQVSGDIRGLLKITERHDVMVTTHAEDIKSLRERSHSLANEIQRDRLKRGH